MSRPGLKILRPLATPAKVAIDRDHWLGYDYGRKAQRRRWTNAKLPTHKSKEQIYDRDYDNFTRFININVCQAHQGSHSAKDRTSRRLGRATAQTEANV
jgi:hypothetical protein